MGYNGEVHKKLWLYVIVCGYNILCNFNGTINDK